MSAPRKTSARTQAFNFFDPVEDLPEITAKYDLSDPAGYSTGTVKDLVGSYDFGVATSADTSGTINGLNVIKLDRGAGEVLSGPYNNTPSDPFNQQDGVEFDDFSYYWVARIDDFGTGTNPYAGFQINQGAVNYDAITNPTGPTGVNSLSIFADGKILWDIRNGGAAERLRMNTGPEGTLSCGVGDIWIGGFIHETTNNNRAIRFNGDEHVTSTDLWPYITTPDPSVKNTRYRINNSYQPGGTNNGISTVAESLWFKGVLTTEEHEKIEGYLAHKWGQTGSLPAGHPYKSNRPVKG